MTVIVYVCNKILFSLSLILISFDVQSYRYDRVPKVFRWTLNRTDFPLLPKLVVFDLAEIKIFRGMKRDRPDDSSSVQKQRRNYYKNVDTHGSETGFTLWPFVSDARVTYSKGKERGEIVDTRGSSFKMYCDSQKILRMLKNVEIDMAATSSQDDNTTAMQIFKILDIKRYFKYIEIYPGEKHNHFAKLYEMSKVNYSDMLYYDDDRRSIRILWESLGVIGMHVDGGIDVETFYKGLKKYNLWRYKVRGNSTTTRRRTTSRAKTRVSSRTRRRARSRTSGRSRSTTNS